VRRRNPVGAHVFVAGGLARRALPYAERIGAEAVQVFVSNPRGWARASGDREQDRLFRDGCTAARIPVFVHSPYLVNLGSPTAATVVNSVAAVRHSLLRGEQIGAAGVIVHAGSAVSGVRHDDALRQVRQHLLPLLDDARPDGPRVLIEPTAGGGHPLVSRVDDLAEYFAALDHHPALGVCLDTCHAWAAGHDIAARGGMSALLDRLTAVVGPGRLGLVHANDTVDALGSRRDRHANIGTGLLGTAPFRAVFRHPATRGVPVVVETPGSEADHRRDLDRLKALRRSAPRAKR
jgi:deoxyribonuclease-4